jgi:hypothetical protein
MEKTNSDSMWFQSFSISPCFAGSTRVVISRFFAPKPFAKLTQQHSRASVKSVRGEREKNGLHKGEMLRTDHCHRKGFEQLMLRQPFLWSELREG